MIIVLATSNEHKVKEFNEMVDDYDIKFISLKDIDFHDEIIENGKTFEENSLIKALAISKKTDLVVLADDTGIEIEELGEHFPGIYSHRYAESNGGPLKTNELLIKKVPGSKAKFTCVLTVMNLEENPLVFKGEMNGTISNKIVNPDAFGYDPIFIPEGYSYPIAYYGDKLKNAISHRSIAFKKFLDYLRQRNLLLSKSLSK